MLHLCGIAAVVSALVGLAAYVAGIWIPGGHRWESVSMKLVSSAVAAFLTMFLLCLLSVVLGW